MAKIPLKAARVAAGLTQQELAEKMGMSRSSIVKIENGELAVRPVFLYAFCQIPGFKEDDILLLGSLSKVDKDC